MKRAREKTFKQAVPEMPELAGYKLSKQP